MAGPDPLCLWRTAILQSLLGRRGVVTAASLWLPLSAIVSTNASIERRPLWPICLALFGVTALRTLACILANDLADRAADRAAGKYRWISELSPAAGAAVVVALIAIGVFGLVSVAAFAATLATVAAYVVSIAIGLLYSLPPAVFKRRGPLGPAAYSLAATLGYVVVPWLCLADNWTSLALLAPAVLLDKWVSLHFHQIVDVDADRRSKNHTFVIALGLPLARRSLLWASCAASVALSAVLLFLALNGPTWRLETATVGAVVALLASLYGEFARRFSDRPTALVRELPSYYLGLTYSLFRVIPPLLLAQAALREPGMWSVFAAAAVSLSAESWFAFYYRYD